MFRRNEMISILNHLAETMTENRDKLIEMDSVVGDGDLGLTMSDGFTAAAQAARESDETDIGKLFYGAGKKMSEAVPSTMGTLMAYGWMNVGKTYKGTAEIESAALGGILDAYQQGVMKLGKAKLGEKTFLDGLQPAIDAFQAETAQGKTACDAMRAAAKAAMDGAEHTKTMLAVHGRAATRGENSRTLLDPGAYVAALMVQSICDTVCALESEKAL